MCAEGILCSACLSPLFFFFLHSGSRSFGGVHVSPKGIKDNAMQEDVQQAFQSQVWSTRLDTIMDQAQRIGGKGGEYNGIRNFQ